jgi:GNAT superfamily N-acetyltransferase
MDIKNEDYFLTTEYNFSSSIGDQDPTRYLNQYFVRVKAHSLRMHDEEVLIGRGQITLILIGLAINHGFDIFDVFDAKQTTLNLGEAIYDFEKYDYKDELQEYYNYELFTGNICFLERLELLPEYRGHGIGKKIIKGFTERFSDTCGLFAMKAFPLQLEQNHNIDNNWYKKMCLNEFEKDDEKAKYKLYSYYRSAGFDQPFNNEYFTMNPALRNDALDSIELN